MNSKSKNIYQKIKEKFGVESDKNMLLILITFALTGSTIAFGLKPLIFYFLGVNDETMIWKKTLYWFLFVFPSYYICLLFYGTVLGQKDFFVDRITKRFRNKNKSPKN